MADVRIIEGYTRDLEIPEHWWEGEVYNTARPFPCHEDKTGPFLRGIFYGVIYPEQEFADGLRERALANDAHRLAQVSRETVETWGKAFCEQNGIDYDEFDYADLVESYLIHTEEEL